MTSLGRRAGADPARALAPRQPSPLTPPPAIMDTSVGQIGTPRCRTASSSRTTSRRRRQRPATPPPVPTPAPSRSTPPPMSTPPPPRSPEPPAPSSGPGHPPRRWHRRRRARRRQPSNRCGDELSEVGQELGTFSGTLGGLADRVERLERALDAATGDLDSVADAIRGPDAAVLMELQGILADVERAATARASTTAIKVLEQLSSQPRDIELLLKLSQQAGRHRERAAHSRSSGGGCAAPPDVARPG